MFLHVSSILYKLMLLCIISPLIIPFLKKSKKLLMFTLPDSIPVKFLNIRQSCFVFTAFHLYSSFHVLTYSQYFRSTSLQHITYFFLCCVEEIPMQQRAAAASLLGKLVGQPMHGPRVAITLARFLPDGLVSAIRDGPGEAVVSCLEQTTETPELVWTPAMAASLSAQLSTMATDLYQEQMKGRVVDWDVPEQASGQHVMKDEPQVVFSLESSYYFHFLKLGYMFSCCANFRLEVFM